MAKRRATPTLVTLLVLGALELGGCQQPLAAAPPPIPSWGPVRLGMKEADAWRALKQAGVAMMPRIDITKAIKRAPRGARLLPFLAKHQACRQDVERMYFRRGGHLVHTWTPLILCASSIGNWELRFDDNTRLLKSIRFSSVALSTVGAADAMIRSVASIYGKPQQIKPLTGGLAHVWRRHGVRIWLSRHQTAGGPTSVFFSLQPAKKAPKKKR